MKRYFLLTLIITIASFGHTQNPAADTVVVEMGKSSKLVFTIQDPADLDTLRQVDFQSLFDDVLDRLAKQYKIEDVTVNPADPDAPADEEGEDDRDEDDWEDDDEWEDDDWNDDDDWDDDDHWNHHDYPDCCKKYGRTSQSFNFEFGMNNYLEDGQFPDNNGAQYTVRPWGSWYVGLGSTQRTHLNNRFYLEWGFGFSWYNFKFEDDRTLITEDENGVHFSQDTRDFDFDKSKLSMTYLNASLVPMFRIGGHHHHHHDFWFWDHSGSGFHVGLGPYAGYRIESHTKQVYEEEDGDKEKDKESDNFYLNNFRYGLRLQFGLGESNIFFQYDLNDLFVEGRGPELNAFSFGLIF